MNRVITFVLVMSVLLVGFGFARLDSSAHAKFSELVEPVFDTVGSLADVAHDVFDNFFPDTRITDDNVPISLENIYFHSSRSQAEFSSFYKYIYSFSVKKNGEWHDLYCVRFDVIPAFSFQAVAPMYLCVYDAHTSHYFEGMVLERTFGLVSVSGLPTDPGGWWDDNAIRKSSKPEQTGYTYSSLAQTFPLFRNLPSSGGGSSGGGSSGSGDTSGGPGEPGWNDGVT